MSLPAPGFLFISEFCEYSTALLKEYERFHPDISITVIKVDENTKKTKALMEAFDIRGVPTLVINNEKHSEGQDVFKILLPSINRGRPGTRRTPDHSIDAAAMDSSINNTDEIASFEPPISTRESNDTMNLKDRLKQLEAMRKQADDQRSKLNESVTSQQMISSRQCDPIDDGTPDFGY